MNIPEEKINQIADLLDFGLRVFYNLKTGEIKDIMVIDNWIDSGLIEKGENPDDTEEIEKNRADYFEFENLDSYHSFQIMVDFTESVEDERLREKLIDALNRSKPYRNFKTIIDYSGPYRQEWFSFKKNRFIEWVKEQIEFENSRKKSIKKK